MVPSTIEDFESQLKEAKKNSVECRRVKNKMLRRVNGSAYCPNCDVKMTFSNGHGFFCSCGWKESEEKQVR